MTESLLLDTNVVSYLVKGDTRAARYTSDLEGKRLCISFVTVAEIRLGASLANWGTQRRERMEQTILSYVVVPYDDEVASIWARIGTDLIRSGRNQQDRSDWWIAACALRHGLPLVTHNTADFAGIAQLQVISHPDPE